MDPTTETFSNPSWMVSFGLAGIGALVMVIAFVMLTVQGFRANIWWGLLVFFVPFLGLLIFSLSKWGMAKGGFLLHTVGLIVGLAGGLSLANRFGWFDGGPKSPDPAPPAQSRVEPHANRDSLPAALTWA